MTGVEIFYVDALLSRGSDLKVPAAFDSYRQSIVAPFCLAVKCSLSQNELSPIHLYLHVSGRSRQCGCVAIRTSFCGL